MQALVHKIELTPQKVCSSILWGVVIMIDLLMHVLLPINNNVTTKFESIYLQEKHIYNYEKLVKNATLPNRQVTAKC